MEKKRDDYREIKEFIFIFIQVALNFLVSLYLAGKYGSISGVSDFLQFNYGLVVLIVMVLTNSGFLGLLFYILKIILFIVFMNHYTSKSSSLGFTFFTLTCVNLLMILDASVVGFFMNGVINF